MADGKLERQVGEVLQQNSEFHEPEYIVIQGAPSIEQAEQRLSLFREVSENVDNDFELIFPGQYDEMVENFVSADNTKLGQINPGNTIEEVQELVRTIDKGEKVIFLTREYHRPRTEMILSHLLLRGNYLVIGAPLDGNSMVERLKAVRERYKIYLVKLVKKIYI